jgi:hypothetical protein
VNNLGGVEFIGGPVRPKPCTSIRCSHNFAGQLSACEGSVHTSGDVVRKLSRHMLSSLVVSVGPRVTPSARPECMQRAWRGCSEHLTRANKNVHPK